MVVSQSVVGAISCINPDCPSPAYQPWGNKFCNSCGAPLQLNNRYIPLRHLGTGGFAAIYTVWDSQSQTERVLKVLLEPSPKAQELFEQEATVLASLHHPGVPKVEPDSYFVVNLGHSAHRRLPCLVMEKINGPTLQDVLDSHPQGCSEAAVQDWLNQAVEILRELHRRQIIHRDIKPSNLMLRLPSPMATPLSNEGTGGVLQGQLVTIDFGGAKQIGFVRVGQQVSSTRLISPGYSPPEQIVGGAVGPTADFYALGQTMIQLLTGQYPPNLEDPVTGELRWRDRANVSPAFADLLDRMVQPDVQKRPASADEIQVQLARISSRKTGSISAQSSSSQIITKAARDIIFVSWVAVVGLSKALGTSALFLLRAITTVIKACLDTVWEMLLGGIGGVVGAIAGYWLAYSSLLGARIADFLTNQLARLIPDSNIQVVPAIILFVLAGLGTAVGLTEAGGFGQRRRRLVTPLMGLLGYGLAWLVWQATPFELERRLVALIAVAVGPLTLSLGLPSHYLLHAFMAIVGTSMVFDSLISLNLLSPDLLLNVFSLPQASLQAFGFSAVFFSLLGITIAFWLGVSYYLIVPILRWLGWR